MKKAPTLYKLKELREIIASPKVQAKTDEGWVPARSIGYFSIRSRIRIAWMVFVGKADAFTWPGNQ